jgi:hypothetical protein
MTEVRGEAGRPRQQRVERRSDKAIKCNELLLRPLDTVFYTK